MLCRFFWVLLSIIIENQQLKESTSFFAKKEAKKLLLLGAVATPRPNPPGAKVFWFFFSKKNFFLDTTAQDEVLPHRPRPLLILTFTLIVCLYLLYLTSVIWLTIHTQNAAGPQIYSSAHYLPQNDFAMFWYSGVLLFDHTATQYGFPLAPSAWMRETFRIPFLAPTPAFHLNWAYPPPMGLLAILYSFLPLGVSYWVFRVFFLAIAAWLYRRAGLSWPTIIMGEASPASLHDAFGGQNGTLTGALLVSSLLLLDRSPRLAGTLAGLICIKPQIGLALPLILLRKARWPTLFVATACVFAVAVVTLPIEGIGAWLWFFIHSRSGPASFVARPFAQQFPASGITVFFTARSLHLGIHLAWACQAFCSVIAACLIWQLWRPGIDISSLTRVAITMCLWILMTPYGYMYDLTGFSVIMSAMCLKSQDWHKAIYALLWLAGGYTGTLANLTGIIWMPLIAAVGSIVIWLLNRRESDEMIGRDSSV